MKELEQAPGAVNNSRDIRQVIREVIKASRYMGNFRLQPGQKLYEMVCVGSAGESVPGLNAVTGDFDPELAIVRECRYEKTAATFDDPINPLLKHPLTGISKASGRVKAGIHRKYIVVDGNIYIDAINEANARKKIIKQYFPQQ